MKHEFPRLLRPRIPTACPLVATVISLPPAGSTSLLLRQSKAPTEQPQGDALWGGKQRGKGKAKTSEGRGSGSLGSLRARLAASPLTRQRQRLENGRSGRCGDVLEVGLALTVVRPHKHDLGLPGVDIVPTALAVQALVLRMHRPLAVRGKSASHESSSLVPPRQCTPSPPGPEAKHSPWQRSCGWGWTLLPHTRRLHMIDTRTAARFWGK